MKEKKNSNRPTRIREKIKQYMYCPYVNSVLIILNLSETISIIISVVLLVFLYIKYMYIN